MIPSQYPIDKVSVIWDGKCGFGYRGGLMLPQPEPWHGRLYERGRSMVGAIRGEYSNTYAESSASLQLVSDSELSAAGMDIYATTDARAASDSMGG